MPIDTDEGVLNKRSFLKIPVSIDRDRILSEFAAIPEEAWGVSHWDVHCSIDVLLLRGGCKGEASDFITREVTNSPILEKLPYIRALIEPDGPFGGAVYAFIFRTKPNGITRVHKDGEEVWHQTHRIHIPIITNDGAFLLAEGRAKHIPVGEAWTFDNQTDHGVVNGNSTRVHLIIDVDPNPKFARLIAGATYDPGQLDPANWSKAQGTVKSSHGSPLLVASGAPLTQKEKAVRGLNVDGFATRVTKLGKKGILLRTPLRIGDIITAVNGVETSALSRTALDHIRVNHSPGETVKLDVIRGDTRTVMQMQLKPNDYFSLRSRLRTWLQQRPSSGSGRDAGG